MVTRTFDSPDAAERAFDRAEVERMKHGSVFHRADLFTDAAKIGQLLELGGRA